MGDVIRFRPRQAEPAPEREPLWREVVGRELRDRKSVV